MFFTQKRKPSTFKASSGLSKSSVFSMGKKNNCSVNISKIDYGRIGQFGLVDENVCGINYSIMRSKKEGGQHPFVVTCLANGEINAGTVSLFLLWFL